ncbi:unnamed protein product [Mesocestoides corti]|uniref:Uncharacterized protein n=1 Tax=Mesocestoides corti TaxID=53468 RepID=A0A3P6GTE0_MESCO|nr:unnamed protein product [Mesocestoides corti]
MVVVIFSFLDTLCSGVLCGENARCVNGQCRCESGFYGDPNYSCQFIGGDRPSANPRCRAPLDPGQCFARLEKYGYDSRTGRCEKFTYTGCQGNSNRFETLEECERECLSRQIGDKCATVQCGYNARCQDGYCVCEDGYEGDPNRECRLTGVREFSVVTTLNASMAIVSVYQGMKAIHGGNAELVKIVEDSAVGRMHIVVTRCVNVRLATAMIPIPDRCEGVQCAANAFCESGYCRCNPGYSGDGFIECIYQGSCANVHCGVNAQCVEGRCECWPGYEGDPDRMCEIASDQAFCGGRRCGQNAFCDRSRCVCERGFEGDPYDVCTPIPPKPELCGNNYCHEKARCHYGVCYCEYGYVGDGVTVCQKIEEDLCKRVQCAENAECEAGLCQCKTGYKGDGFSECTPVAVDPNSCNGRYCGANAECINNECTCISGYTGDPYDICTRERPLPDTCRGVECGSNAYCHDGRCVCYEGFVGNPNLACRPNHDASCIGIRCGVNAYCTNGQCVCRHGYTGDPAQICYPDWGSSGNDLCRSISCHPNATCSLGQCRCRDGFEGDGFLDCWPKDPANLCDCRGFPSTMAGCSNGKCRCMPGFWVGRDNYCDECRGHGECAANAQCSYDSQIQHYRCRCDYGFLGDGAIACIPGSVANKTQAAQCRIPCHKFGTCDEYDGRCKCRPGFVGNGYTYCDFDCSQCLAEARCVPESSQCICPPGYTGDGIRVCRPATSQGAFALQIVKDGDTIRVREGSGAFTLRCILSGDVHGVQARWLTPGDVGQTDEHQTHEGRELWLTLDEPNASNTGLYVCQASRMTDTVQVIIEPQKHSQSKQLFLTSDNGILTVETQKGPTTAAQIWHIDCKADHLVYTSDSGHALRFGNASAVRLSQPPEFIVHDAYSKFTWIAVDPTSGNVFAIDDKQKRIVVVNPGRPNQMYTFKKLYNRTSNDDFVVGGIAIHPGLSLVYWAQADSTDSAVKESVIMVASMADPNRVSEVVRVTGAPVSMSLAVSDGIVGTGNTAGRLCWLQRRQLLPYSRSEIHCAQLDVSGRNIHSKSVLRSFDTSEEPSCGLAQDDHAIFWTNLYRRTYQSHNPSSLVYVKGVCCSNGFQSMAIHNVCKRSMTNACSYENGRCRYFCLPGGRESSRTCRCPDDQPNCIAEHA